MCHYEHLVEKKQRRNKNKIYPVIKTHQFNIYFKRNNQDNRLKGIKVINLPFHTADAQI